MSPFETGIVSVFFSPLLYHTRTHIINRNVRRYLGSANVVHPYQKSSVSVTQFSECECIMHTNMCETRRHPVANRVTCINSSPQEYQLACRHTHTHTHTFHFISTSRRSRSRIAWHEKQCWGFSFDTIRPERITQVSQIKALRLDEDLAFFGLNDWHRLFNVNKCVHCSHLFSHPSMRALLI